MVEAARLLRERSGDRTLVQGEKLLSEAVAAGVTIDRVFQLEGSASLDLHPGIDLVSVTPSVMERLAPTGDRWGPVAVVEIPRRAARTDRPVLVAIDIADPGNLGTLIRTAAGFGYDVTTVGGADPFAPKVMRAGAGGHFRTHVAPGLIPDDRVTVATVVDGGSRPEEVAAPADHALLIGSEARGLPDELAATATWRATIPMMSGESLNAAIAGAILMYVLSGKRSGGLESPGLTSPS